MSKRFYRNVQGLLLLLSLLVLAESFYFQYFKGLQPCPLCLMQRACVFFLTIFCLAGLCLSTLKRARLVAIVQLFFSAAGLFFATRQVWLQSLPAEQAPACMPGLDVLIRYFPWQDVLRVLVWGAGDCAEAGWSWWGLSMPVWSALYFLTLLVVSAMVFWRLGRTLEQLE